MKRVLMIGDVFGRPGRRAVRALMPKLMMKHNIDFTVINAENSAGGFGITSDIVEELFDYAR